MVVKTSIEYGVAPPSRPTIAVVISGAAHDPVVEVWVDEGLPQLMHGSPMLQDMISDAIRSELEGLPRWSRFGRGDPQ